MSGFEDATVLDKQFADVHGRHMAYASLGDIKAERTLAFLHGNPTSSYLWRNIARPLSDLGRCIIPDLIGMGDSDKLANPKPDSYSFVEHREYLDELLRQLGCEQKQIVLVVHDWGSALGFDWARRHPDNVAGIAYMEAIVRPVASWDDWPEAARGVFQGFRSEAGEQMVLDNNVFVERVLPGSILRDLTEEEMNEYRRPFTSPGLDRLPTLTWPRQIPIAGAPADVVEIVGEYADWLSQAELPKLFINADPGAILTGAAREFCRSWPNQTEVSVAGSHFIQEDSPAEIAAAIREWLK
ncbi:MAG: haloalkane dehalogenase [Gammaproteobacteria bacterium AqS3]|nr:haloalkane dehalogenase [Gammaproteobacteria bacterium AqS3]